MFSSLGLPLAGPHSDTTARSSVCPRKSSSEASVLSVLGRNQKYCFERYDMLHVPRPDSLARRPTRPR